MKWFMVSMMLLSLFTLPGLAAGPSSWTAVLQCRLLLAGFDPGPIDGIKGKKTLQAIEQFRQQIADPNYAREKGWADLGISSDNPGYWYNVLLSLTEGQLYKCEREIRRVVQQERTRSQGVESEAVFNRARRDQVDVRQTDC